jgi:hypothetical protein
MRILFLVILIVVFNCNKIGNSKFSINQDGSGILILTSMKGTYSVSKSNIGGMDVDLETFRLKEESNKYHFASINEVNFENVDITFKPEEGIVTLKTPVGVRKGIFRYIGVTQEVKGQLQETYDQYMRLLKSKEMKDSEQFNPFFFKIALDVFRSEGRKFRIVYPKSIPKTWKFELEKENLMDDRGTIPTLTIPYADVENEIIPEIELEIKR